VMGARYVVISRFQGQSRNSSRSMKRLKVI
jgi:hypothetical protein